MNSSIPKERCSVKYPDFNEAVKLCLKVGVNCSVAKSDMPMAFRNVPLKRGVWKWLVMKAEHPVTRKIYYFVDKCLPFGCSISCAIFQEISNAVVHIVSYKVSAVIINYLDDYLFAAALKSSCDEQVYVFLGVCQKINFQVAMEKTHWGCMQLTFLGMLLDTERQIVGIPLEKIAKALELIRFFLGRSKVTMLQFQKLWVFEFFV